MFRLNLDYDVPLNFLFKQLANEALTSAQKIKAIEYSYKRSLRIRYNETAKVYEDIGLKYKPGIQKSDYSSTRLTRYENERQYENDVANRAYVEVAMVEKSQGVAVNIVDGGYGLGLAHKAAILGDVAVMKWLIEVQGGDINLRNRAGHTPLMHAVQYNQIEMIQYLIGKGADINLATTDLQSFSAEGDIYEGTTALHIAVRYGLVEASEILLTANAVLKKDKYGRTAYDKCHRHLAILTNPQDNEELADDDFGPAMHRDHTKIPSIENLQKISRLIESAQECKLNPDYNLSLCAWWAREEKNKQENTYHSLCHEVMTLCRERKNELQTKVIEMLNSLEAKSLKAIQDVTEEKQVDSVSIQCDSGQFFITLANLHRCFDLLDKKEFKLLAKDFEAVNQLLLRLEAVLQHSSPESFSSLEKFLRICRFDSSGPNPYGLHAGNPNNFGTKLSNLIVLMKGTVIKPEANAMISSDSSIDITRTSYSCS